MTFPSATRTELRCTACSRLLLVPYSALGKPLGCPGCGGTFRHRFPVRCPGCKDWVRIRTEYIGRLVRCRGCRLNFRLMVPVCCPACGAARVITPGEIGGRTRCSSCAHAFEIGPIPGPCRHLKPFQLAALLLDGYRESLRLKADTEAEKERLVSRLAQQLSATRAERSTLLAQLDSLGRELAEQRAAVVAAELRHDEAAAHLRASLEAQARASLEAAREDLNRRLADLARRMEAEAADFAAQREALHGVVQCLRLELATVSLSREEIEARSRWQELEAGRLRHELAEMTLRRGQEVQARQEYETRVKSLEFALAELRAEAETVGRELQTTRLERDDQRALRRQAEDAVAKARQAAEEFRRERDQAQAELSRLRDELARMCAAHSALAAEHESLAEQSREAAALLQREREAGKADRARQEEDGKSKRELLSRTEQILADLTATREALARSESLLTDIQEQLGVERKRAAEQLERADDLERQLAEGRRQAEECGRGRQLQTQRLKQILAREATLRQELDSLRGVLLARRAEPSADPAGGRTDLVWELIASGSLPLPRGPAVPLAGPPPRRILKTWPMAPRPGREVPIELLRGLAVAQVPDPGALEKASQQLGAEGMALALEVASGGDALTRRGAARLCAWVAEQAAARGDRAEARTAAEHAARLLQQLMAEDPRSVSLRAEVVAVTMALARHQREAQDTDASMHSLLAAREAAHSLVIRQPEAGAYRRALARCLHDLGLCLFRGGRTEDAEGCLRQAIQHQQKAVQHTPGAGKYASELERMRVSLQSCLARYAGQAPRS